jgi:hypothetical protein
MDLSDPAGVVASLGPLVVSAANPRYFAVAGDGRIVYRTGAHFNSNLQDGIGQGRDCPDEPERFDFDAYLTRHPLPLTDPFADDHAGVVHLRRR